MRHSRVALLLMVCGLVMMLATGSALASMKTMKVGLQQTVAAVTQEATLAGWEILEKGGNAFDCIVAMSAANGVSDAGSNGLLGADVQCTLYSAADKKVYDIESEGAAPALATIEWYEKNNNGIIPTSDGLLSGTVPGIVSEWVTILDKWGTMSLSEVLQPAIRLAEGFNNPKAIPSGSKLKKYPSSVATFDLNPDGSSKIKPFDIIRYPQFAVSMRKLVAAEQTALKAGSSRHDALYAARDRFYKGDMAQEMAEFSEKNGGLFRYEDFASYHTHIWEPVSTTYRGYNVYSNRSAGQGPTILFWLNLLENYDLKAMKHNSLNFWHTMVETGKLAYADREWLSDVEMYPVPYKGLLSKEYAKDRIKIIDPNKANNDFRIGNPWPYQGDKTPPNPWGLTDAAKTTSVQIASANMIDDTDWAEVHGDTSGISCSDKWGNVVVMTPSLHSSWGTGVVMGNTGIIFNCRGDYFYLDPLHPNALKPGERPTSTLTTCMVTDAQGRPVATISSPGGDDQPTIITQWIVAFLDFGMNAQDAIECPRMDLGSFPSKVFPHTMYPGQVLFDGRVPADVQKKMAEMGNKVGAAQPDYAFGTRQHAQAFDYSRGYVVKFAAADPRGPNDAMAK